MGQAGLHPAPAIFYGVLPKVNAFSIPVQGLRGGQGGFSLHQCPAPSARVLGVLGLPVLLTKQFAQTS